MNTSEPQRRAGSRNDPDSCFIKGTVSRVTYRSSESGFGVLHIELAPDSKNILNETETSTSLIGPISEVIGPGCSFIARGNWQIHPKFGAQFKAWSITETLPSTKETIASYLGSGAVKGFGPVLAQRVVDVFGADSLRVLDEEIDRLEEVPGIGPKKLEEIEATWRDKQTLREVLLFFQSHGISLNLAQRIYNSYGNRAIETVKSNPYLLAKEMWGVGFHTADRIAVALGTDPTSPNRVRAGIEHIIRRSSDDGHTFIPVQETISKVTSLIQLDNEHLITGEITQATLEGDIIQEGDHLYSPLLYAAEQQLASDIAKRIGSRGNPIAPIEETIVSQIINTKSTIGDGRLHKTITLSEQQQQAVSLAAQRSLVVITGGPGCGKTTVVRTVVSMFKQAGLAVKLAAPTGRAAQRMAEVCGIKASTIHRLLKYDPIHRTFIHNTDHPLPLSAIVIDESSMIDLLLAASLFDAIPKGARIVIVGDADQLPSVGPGRVLSDLLSVPEIPRVQLTTLFRRTQESAITHIAHQINTATLPHIPEPDGITKTDAYYLPCQDPTKAASLVERLVVDQIPKKFGFTIPDITVLSPMNQGELGIISLNKRLQERIIPIQKDIPYVSIGNTQFRLGDRVVQRSNNYNIIDGGVFNGDQGEVIGIDTVQECLVVRLWDGREVEYASNVIHQLDLAYAITIHRSQGSEIPAVVLVLHNAHSVLLERQLIYTAITRAKKLLIIVGTKQALTLAVKRTKSKCRHTELITRIKKELQ